jgi:hypothetical protein
VPWIYAGLGFDHEESLHEYLSEYIQCAKECSNADDEKNYFVCIIYLKIVSTEDMPPLPFLTTCLLRFHTHNMFTNFHYYKV